MAATTCALRPGMLDQANALEASVICLESLDAESSDTSGADGAGQPESREPASNSVYWPELVSRIRQGDESGMEDLYRVFARGIRFYLCRQLGPQELDDKVHDTFLIVVQAIQRGDLR